jgi:hypothetical protein
MNSGPWRCFECGTSFPTHRAACSSCFEAGTLLQAGARPSAAIDFVPEITTARALAKAAWTPTVSTAYPTLRLGRGALVLVYGAPGNGKSTFATLLLDGLAGPVVLQSIEESPGPSLAARLARCFVRRDDFFVVGRASVDQLVDCVRTRRAVGLAVDSVQLAAFTPEELRHLLLVLPELQVLVAVAQVNKRGRVEGRERLLHEADVAIECAEMRWSLVKSRYQPIDARGTVMPRGEPANEDA